MRWLRSNWLYIVITLTVAFAVHVASVAFLPQLVMMRALSKMASLHDYNTMTHQPRVTSASRAVVRPSPDLLYSACPFDIDKIGSALRVRVTGMPQSYWSASLFDAETNNFYALNDRQAKTGSVDFVIVGPHTGIIDDAAVGAPRQVRSPTVRGLVLFRTLIDEEKHFAAIDKVRRSASCTPYGRQ